MPVKQYLVSGQSVPVDVTFSIALWFYPGQVILHFQHMTTHTANLPLLPHMPKLTPASVMWDVIWKHGLTLCEHTVYLEVLSKVFKLEGSYLFINFEALLWRPCLLLENLLEWMPEQHCREMWLQISGFVELLRALSQNWHCVHVRHLWFSLCTRMWP